MKELPILFSTEMVQAILRGEKTQTRRAIKTTSHGWDAQQMEFKQMVTWSAEQLKNKSASIRRSLTGTHAFFKDAEIELLQGIKCPYGMQGDFLWVKEKFARTVNEYVCYDTLSYFADNFHRDIKRFGVHLPDEFKCEAGWYDEALAKEVKWKSSRFMPKEVARLWLNVEEVRVERVQDISEEDILAEGVRIPVNGPNNPVFVLGKENSAFSFLPDKKEGEKYTQYQILKAFWAELWCKTYGRASWDANPWVWVVKFRRILNNKNEVQNK